MNKILLFLCCFLVACSPYNLYLPAHSLDDNFGRHILVVVDHTRVKAGATFAGGVPYIYMNTDYMRQFPKETQYFIFYHEIAHHKLDHFLFAKDPKQSELEADCWAAKYLINHHGYGAAEISIIRRSLIHQFNQGADRFHDSGPIRAKRLREECLK